MDRKTACVEQVGKVVGVTGDKVRVLIMAQSACAGCHAKGVCGMSETEPREVELQANGEDYQVNDTVRVQIASRQGLKAVRLYDTLCAGSIIALWVERHRLDGGASGLSRYCVPCALLLATLPTTGSFKP